VVKWGFKVERFEVTLETQIELLTDSGMVSPSPSLQG